MAEPIPGFVVGIVTSNSDPLAIGRIKVSIPILLEEGTPYWISPGNWPGAGGIGVGSQYEPPPIGAQVSVIFEHGLWDIPDAHAIYLSVAPGLKSDMTSASPLTITEATSAANARKRTVIWEKPDLAVIVIDEDSDHRVIIEAYDGGGTAAVSVGAKVEVRAKDGASGKGASVSIQGRTSIEIYSQGLIDIEAGVLQLQGRRVLKGTGRTI